MRLEEPNFKGTNACNYAEDHIKEIKNILGIQEKIEYKRKPKVQRTKTTRKSRNNNRLRITTKIFITR